MTEPNDNPLTPSPPAPFVMPTEGEEIHNRNGDRHYWIGKVRSKGAFGSVVDATDDWGNELVAKVIMPGDRPYGVVQTAWRRETETLVHVRHPNITFVHDAFEYRKTFYLILERCSQELRDLIFLEDLNSDFWLPWVARDLLNALHFVHMSNYVHKDIHPRNVFLLWQKDRFLPSKDP